jgi:hypothetical protein
MVKRRCPAAERIGMSGQGDGVDEHHRERRRQTSPQGVPDLRGDGELNGSWW